MLQSSSVQPTRERHGVVGQCWSHSGAFLPEFTMCCDSKTAKEKPSKLPPEIHQKDLRKRSPWTRPVTEDLRATTGSPFLGES